MKKITLSLFLALSCVITSQVNAQDFTQNLRAEFQQKLENREISQQDTKWEVTSQHISTNFYKYILHYFFCNSFV